MPTLLDHLMLIGALFGFGFVFGFMMAYIIVTASKKKI